MSSNIIYHQGKARITVAATESIAVFSEGSAVVKREIGYPNVPPSISVLGTVTAGETVFGSYTSGATIIIEAGAAPVYYETGSAPRVNRRRGNAVQGTPTAMTTAATITVTGILSGIITGTHTAGATQAYTLPTGTLMDAAAEWAIGESFDWVLMNLSAAAADTITLTAGTDHTIVGVAIVQSVHVTTGGITGATAQWRTRKTAANTFVTYRIA